MYYIPPNEERHISFLARIYQVLALVDFESESFSSASRVSRVGDLESVRIQCMKTSRQRHVHRIRPRFPQ